MKRMLLLLVIATIPCTAATAAPSEPVDLLANGSFEEDALSYGAGPAGWTYDAWMPQTALTAWDDQEAFEGLRSLKLTAATLNDIRWFQRVQVKPHTNYLLTGWIKTAAVSHSPEFIDAGANLCLFGTYTRSEGVFGTRDWTPVRLIFNSGSDSAVNIGLRLGYWSGTATGTAWFDSLRLTEIRAGDPHPSWKILVLIYGTTDLSTLDAAGVRHRYVGQMSELEKQQVAESARRFVEQDIPALTSRNMIPTLTIRHPARALDRLTRYGSGWWPGPWDTEPERDPAFDSVIVIWRAWATDQATGRTEFLGGAAGLTLNMWGGPTYATLVSDAGTWYGHRNVFKHEYGHSLLSYFEAMGTTPRPTVTNHAGPADYVSCRTGQPYVWIDETEASPIPNSIYNNEAGFTHDYYSGQTATWDQPARCLGITPEAWATGGPVSKPERPRTAEEQIASLWTSVETLVFLGELGEGEGNALQVKLEAADRALARQGRKTAANVLRAFENQLGALVRSGRLLENRGRLLRAQAGRLAVQLRG